MIRISAQQDVEPAHVSSPQPYAFLASLFALGIFSVALATGWWAVIQSPDLLSRTDNARRSIADRYVIRGTLFDRENKVINNTILSDDNFVRNYIYTDLASITGYTHPVFGQAGLESTLDGYLRGNQGNASSLVWWHYLLYGTPPPGLDIRLSIDLELQNKADELLGNHTGALILLNAQSGEILSMSSHPTYDPNLLDDTGNQLQTNPAAPLLNRAAQGTYPPGSILLPLQKMQFEETGNPDAERLATYYDLLGLYSAPELRLPVGIPSKYGEVENIHVSPLQLVLVFSTLNNKGIRPAPRIALAVNTPTQGWVILPASSEPRNLIEQDAAELLAESLQAPDQPYWQYCANGTSKDGKTYTWLVMGTLPNWQGTPLTLLVLLEENNASMATTIGKTLLIYALEP
jgi:cell division protein FtsI/penicillin-binding protein 2